MIDQKLKLKYMIMCEKKFRTHKRISKEKFKRDTRKERFPKTLPLKLSRETGGGENQDPTIIV